MLVTLEINNKDKSYEWFLAWMASQTALNNQKSRFAPWARSHQLSVETVVEQRKNGSSSALFKFVAGPGTHYFKYKNAWLQVSYILAPAIESIHMPYIRSNVKGKPDLCN